MSARSPLRRVAKNDRTAGCTSTCAICAQMDLSTTVMLMDNPPCRCSRQTPPTHSTLRLSPRRSHGPAADPAIPYTVLRAHARRLHQFVGLRCVSAATSPCVHEYLPRLLPRNGELLPLDRTHEDSDTERPPERAHPRAVARKVALQPPAAVGVPLEPRLLRALRVVV